MTGTVIALLVVSAVALLLCLLALADEVQRALSMDRLYPPKHSWESTQGETTRLDDQPKAQLVALDEDQAVWRIPE